MRRPATKPKPAPMSAVVPVKARPRLPVWLMAGLLLLVTTAVYWPATGHGFVNFDDPVFVTENPHVQGGLTWAGVKWAFQLNQADYWHPLTWLSLMLDASLFGQQAGGFHFTNVALHAANTVLLFLWLRMSTGALWRSVAVAALFALHPLRVESVAWVTERKDVLSTFFGFLSLLFYVRYAQKQSRVERRASRAKPSGAALDSRASTLDYGLALLFLASGLMSKAMLVTWPFVMLLLDYWPLGRMQKAEVGDSAPVLRSSTAEGGRDTQHADVHVARSTLGPTLLRLVLEKIPFLVLSGSSCVLTYFTEGGGGNRLLLWHPRRWFGWRTCLWPTLVIWARLLACQAGGALYAPRLLVLAGGRGSGSGGGRRESGSPLVGAAEALPAGRLVLVYGDVDPRDRVDKGGRHSWRIVHLCAVAWGADPRCLGRV